MQGRMVAVAKVITGSFSIEAALRGGFYTCCRNRAIYSEIVIIKSIIVGGQAMADHQPVELLQTYKTPQTSAELNAATWTGYMMLLVLGVFAAAFAMFLK
ncbi:hypothetical protein SY88_08205 [Clostridiales bacterium PH28_bin88]|nr:hypothetical protein SY88_08205 [Clostridiales bacterium PH28_bin88]